MKGLRGWLGVVPFALGAGLLLLAIMLLAVSGYDPDEGRKIT